MSTQVTRKTSYISLLENSLHELFSPDSKGALLNYDELRLLNLDELKLIDTKELHLLDTKQFQLLDFALIGSFFQYIGALSITLALGFMVGLGAYALHGTVNTTVLAKDTSKADIAVTYPSENNVMFKNIEKSSASPVSTFEVLIANNEGDSDQPVQVRVLGTSDVLTEVVDVREVSVHTEVGTPVAVPASLESCSFSVVEGARISKYSDGGRLVSAKAIKICADTNTDPSNYSWNLGGRVYETSDNCISSSVVAGASSLDVTLSSDAGTSMASCSLSLGGQQVAVIN